VHVLQGSKKKKKKYTKDEEAIVGSSRDVLLVKLRYKFLDHY